MSPRTNLRGALDDEELFIIEGSKNAARSSENCRNCQKWSARRNNAQLPTQEILPQASKTDRRHPRTACTSCCSKPLGKRVNHRSRPRSTTLASQQQREEAAPHVVPHEVGAAVSVVANGTRPQLSSWRP